ncbi:enoyl-CoA hydratase/isomerase family protein [Halanaeroarchaeum sp. HSR-CO]|uniref:enoyl-CoA hydratase/isomerase family protein n=1 Tax=Halanaeroarchaeum sp. HSR-CO TaxID=2866382 RepID=UPI0037BF11CC
MTVSDDDGLRRITIDRPEARNALTLGMAADIADAIETAEPADHYAILLEGVGESFSAGGDVVAMQNRGTDVRAEFERIADTFGRVVEAAMTADVPIVAKVQGDAIGAGLSLVAVSDLAYASTDARFSVAFVRVGLVPDTGGSVLLPHLIGLRETKRLALTGEFFDGTEAADLGLVTDAVPADQLDDIVDDMLDTLADQPTRIVGLIREAIHGGIGRDWRSALEHENQIQAQARDTVEHAESVQAFVERWGLK